MLELLFILLMLGMIGATVYTGLRERKARMKGVKPTKAKSGKKTAQAVEEPKPEDDFGSGNQEQFEFNPDEFK